ncbi:ABC transporter ATP-binding protein [uncultured Sneathiella sp.]|uniref:oligopeptide/dipeptide ABC transporter ATP-binding protein n=1 Tax=uncultured Sneathiella sp. TaxID=879315 RepID=UPI002594E8C6|nr:ABC transporter ATP-binding protein [uncultured Sneathiella sp.]
MSALLEVFDLKKYYTLGGKGLSDGSLVSWIRNRFTNAPKDTQVLHAVDGVNFVISKGESLGLVGESGCGKSTLVGMLARLSDSTSGSIKFAGKDIGSVRAKQFHAEPERSELQIVFQDPHESLNPRFTAFDTIAEPLRRLAGLSSKAELRARVEAVATQVDLPLQLLGRFPHQLSGGQKARVNIARAIALSPKLLILDEPTSALDVSVQAVILKLLVRLKQELGMSYLFVSHDLNVVRLLCDRVIVMYLGQIIEEGPAEDIFTKPLHPYTRALTSAIPGHNKEDASAFRLEGDPLSPVDPNPNACRFYGRCPNGSELCIKAAPPKFSSSFDHYAVCHFPVQPH